VIVVSNRLPYDIPRPGTEQRPRRNVGGLVNALEPVLAESGGAWIGWDGHTLSSANLQATRGRPRSFRTDSGVALHGVPLSERELARYYRGLSNRALWPLYHGFLDKGSFVPEDWQTYVRVNQRFAEATMGQAGPRDRVWVHDYQLVLVPQLLRQLGWAGRIDFFLHIPFPPPEIYRALPWRKELLRGFLGADSIGFHVPSYRDNFVRTVRGLFPRDVSVTRDAEDEDVLIRHPWGTTRAAAIPIGIDVAAYEELAERPEVVWRAERLRSGHGRRPIVFSADRLDYTKGILQRLLAVERFLVRYPERAQSFDLVQVVVPSRSQVEEYRELKREIDRHVGRINGRFEQEGWTPIHHLYRALDRDELVAHYRACSVALVTPLRDGMNLVALEFLASRTDDDGALVLSEFAGVAEHLGGATQVNPYDLDGVADALRAALDLPREARRRTMRGLRRIVRDNDVSRWAARCLNGAGAPAAARPPRRASALER
jgi:trehalose 6-phosphate synthase